MSVDFDGKVRSVNKKSYRKLVRSLSENDEIVNIKHYRLFREVAITGRLPEDNRSMRDVISEFDRDTLFKKPANAIAIGDTSRALLMINKDAEVDQYYFQRNSSDTPSSLWHSIKQIESFPR